MSAVKPDVVLMLDWDGKIHSAVPGDETQNALAESMVGKQWVKTVVPASVEKIERLLSEARTSGVAAIRQIAHRHRDDREVLLEYSVARIGKERRFVAIGRNLDAVVEIQSRLIAAQQAMERDYWRYRATESRYRYFFNTSNDAVAIVAVDDLTVVDLNPAGARALGLTRERSTEVVGRSILDRIRPDDRDLVRAAFTRTSARSRAAACVVQLGQDRTAWTMRPTLVRVGNETVYVISFTPERVERHKVADRYLDAFDELLENIPDGFAVIDGAGDVVRVNRTFLDMVQEPTDEVVLGRSLATWLGRPGADVSVLISNVRAHGAVRLFSTTIVGSHGIETEVEISAAGNLPERPQWFGVVLRDVSRRLLPAPRNDDRLSAAFTSLTRRVGKASLPDLVKEAVEAVEQLCIEASLDLAQGNRTAAAELLGLSRQSLYAKLSKYQLEDHGRRDDIASDA